MKKTVQNIDTAIKDLYQIELPFSADDFLMNVSGVDEAALPQGTLFVQEEKEDLSLGIYFHPAIKNSLSRCETLQSSQWSPQETNAFATAAEEISHFVYLVYHANQGRNVSQFELELQGEIDKFLLLFFQNNSVSEEIKFDVLYTTVFENFHWHPSVTPEQMERYEAANAYAKKFTNALKTYLCDRKRYPELLKFLRGYYRLSPADKISYLHKG